ncbi:hypothetical protein D081_1280 [Anaerovibrio sp. JC8]|uniref:DUF3329 domain-containing protein n=1 Tax=Anaerovibrio sp. JC8 TaxID=1240085 RepID=UPI000A0E5B84|nr:DUF6056 family protein [Anaerovibrio sp. JC8]ORU00186.1 hypothetical protein D081_1280 [Anaerovibrio sp. JC8]
MSQTKNYVWQTGLILTALFLLMLMLNILMPLHRDDYDYSMIYTTAVHIENFSDVLYSCYMHYMLHGGRMVTVFCLDLFLWLGKIWFDIANALMFVALVVLIYFHARRDTSLTKEPVMVAIASLLAWLSFPHFGEVAIWKSGSTVYLWSAVPVALFLLPYNLSLKKGESVLGGWMLLPMLLFGVIAGWSVENLAVTVVGLSALISWYMKKNGNMPAWMLSGCVGALIGLVGLVAAPGNFVRYDDQGQGKGILTHIGNQFAGNGEMVLYILPMILILLIAWRIFKIKMAQEKGIALKEVDGKITTGQWILLGLIILLVVSYFNGSFVAWALRDALYSGVMVPVGLTDPKVLDKVNNIFRGFEEMAIYWFIIFLIYGVAKKKLGLSGENIKLLSQHVKAREVWNRYESVRYAGIMLALALLNNMVMLAAPTFPARATFSSVCMIIIATLAVLREPIIRQYYEQYTEKLLYAGAFGIGLFTISAATVVMYTMQQEHNARIEIVEETVTKGEPIAYMEPIKMTNRALRHVFFVDFDNSVTKGGLCKYYGLEDIKVNKDDNNR